MPFKEALFWVGLTVLGTGLFFIVEGGSQQMPLAIAFTVVGVAAVAYSVYAHDNPDKKLRPPVWMALLLCTWLLVGYDIYDRNTSDAYHWKMRQDQERAVYGKSYRNESVQIDGKKFDHCNFENVTFIYAGVAPTDLVECHFTGTTYLKTSSDALKGYMVLQEQLRKMAAVQTGSFFVAGVDANGNMVPIPPPIPGPQDAAKGQDASTAVFMECQLTPLPLTIPSGQQLRILPLTRKRLKEHNSSFYEVTGDSRKETQWPAKSLLTNSAKLHNPGSFAYSCTVSNHGEKNMLYVSVPIDVNVENDKPAVRISPVVGALDAGKQSTFYLVNDCDVTVAAIWQETARVQILGEFAQRDVPLRRTFSSPIEQIMSFFPTKVGWVQEYGKASCE
jgi:hypothetical protein